MGSLLRSKKAPAPPPSQGPFGFDLGQSIGQYVSGYTQALPQVLAAERQYRPEFLGLNLADISSFLGGTGGMEGLYGLGRQATAEAQQTLMGARAAELGGMAGQAPLTRGLMEALSPEQAFAVRAQQAEAERAAAAAQRLTPQEQRQAEQAARESFGQRGMLGSTGSVATELLGRENILAGKRQEAAAARGDLFNLASSFYTAPGLSLLGSQPLSYTTGQQQLGLGLGAIGSAVPQMINPDAGPNLAMQERANQLQMQAAMAQASAAKKAGKSSMIGGIASGIGAAIAAFSDKRMKTDIKKVGKTNKGLPIYTFKYKGDNMTQMGVMAQDVEKKNPKAVKEVNGLKAVNYALVR
jgi:hypothetical protein